MAFEQNLHPVALPASGDLSAAQFKFTDVDSNGRLVIPTIQGQRALGVLQDKPNALGIQGEMGVVSQITKLRAGAAFNAGAELMSDSSGRAITATGSGLVIAIALEAATAADVYVAALLVGPYPTSAGNFVNSYKQRVALTAAQITTLHSVPVSLVAAPGAGYTLVFEWLTLQFTYGSVQFTGGGVVMPVYHGATTDLSVTGGVAAATIQAAANAHYFVKANPAAGGLALTTNVGIDLYAATADFAAGNSTAVVELAYSVIKLG
jgi:hypothetical protein